MEERASYIKQYLEAYTGEGNNKVYALETEYIIHFLKSNRVYIANETGKLEQADPIIIKEDTVAGAFEGSGTEQDPYIIMSIEDLVWLSNQTNSGTDVFRWKWLVLGKPLDFKSEWSYKDAKATYSYDENTNSFIPDENSETTLMELCTTGGGFVPIGEFYGNFNGKGYTISNIYINRSGNCGLFGSVGVWSCRAAISDLTINGKITSTNGNAGGFVGGLIGYDRDGAQSLSVIDCTNNARIEATEYAGGIVGYPYLGGLISNCVNKGDIAGKYAGGIAR